MSSKSSAAATYKEPTLRGGSPRETEGRALLEAARRLSLAQAEPADRDGLLDIVRLNWRLWTIFQSEISAPACQLPHEIRQNMLTLCNYVDKRTVEILADPRAELLSILININRNIAAGLLTNPDADDAHTTAPREAPLRLATAISA
ncbi:MAG: flagellar biosynthesis regulator FlaF [Alphaproteobacteria bacterium]